MNVIFLDVDGVLNSQQTDERCNGVIGIDSDKVARLAEIDEALQDWFISWDYCKRLLQEQAQIEDMLKKMGYEP